MPTQRPEVSRRNARGSRRATAPTGAFIKEMQALGRHPTAKVLDQQIVPANQLVARRLELPQGALVVRIRRVRLADRMPLSFDETYLPKELGQKVMADNLDTEPIFSLLEQKYNTPLVEAEYQLEAVCAHATVATALRIGVGSAILLVDRTSYSIGHRLSRLRKASLPGRPDPIRDPPSTADPRPAERRFPRMNFRRTLPRGRKHKNLGCVVRHRMNADLLQSNEQRGYSPLSQVR
jgi:hypothetical protein